MSQQNFLPSSHLSEIPPQRKKNPRFSFIGLLFLSIILGGIVYQVWEAGQQHTSSGTVQVSYNTPTPLAIANSQNTPIAPISPLFTVTFAYPKATYIPENYPRLGVYLPRTGVSQVNLITATLRPTNAISFPTSPPAYVETVAALAETFVISPSFDSTAIALANQGCAPTGLPVGGLLTQYFHRWHSGIDLGVSIGTPVLATHSGTVTFAEWSYIGYGNLVIIQNGAFITYYAHLNEFNVVAGQVITQNALIGWSGNTGNSSGPHVHYETRLNDVPLDPLTFDAYGYISC
jgi:murein DD-endopeptidase MepM/ murein hydrolase activator NlpD